jgi:hypothetical protein
MQDATLSIAIRKAVTATGYPSASQKSLIWKTLVCTRGRAFPLSDLAACLRCPGSGSRGVVCLFEPPGNAVMADKRKRFWVSRHS